MHVLRFVPVGIVLLVLRFVLFLGVPVALLWFAWFVRMLRRGPRRR